MTIETTWRGPFRSDEAKLLHADAFGGPPPRPGGVDWEQTIREHSLGWVTARSGAELVGFVNVISDGMLHAWLQDLMVAGSVRHQGIGRELVAVATTGARSAGYHWLHVDFEDRLRPFYFDACGFSPTAAGLLRL